MGIFFNCQRLNLTSKLFPLVLFFLLSLRLQSQESTKNDIGSWMVFSMDNEISERWSIPVVGILCYENWTEQTEFGFIRTGVSYKTNPNLKLTLGTAYVDSQPLYHHEFETLTTQFWLYEEASLKAGKHIKHRFRLENRWITKPTDNLFNVRFRYRLEFKKNVTKNMYIKCTDEPFFNFDELHIDQNRFFLGIGGKIGKDISMEAGYFKTHVRKDNYDRIRVAVHLKTTFFQRNIEDITSKKIKEFPK
ncbi:MAG: DUF2490 domain-containing protein [Bacteroidota bacterium]